MEKLAEYWSWVEQHKSLEIVLILAFAFLLARIFDWIVRKTLLGWAKRTSWEFDDEFVRILRGPVIKTIVLAGIALAAQRLGLEEKYESFTIRAIKTIGVLVWTTGFLRLAHLVLRVASKRGDKFLALEERTFPLFDNLAKVLILGGAIYLLISVWGKDATGWLASAGIVGLAIGFAAQDTLANLFAGIFIIVDAPYSVGDTINLESGERGKVQHIGLRSTRILTRDDVEVTIPNSVMGNARIVNESTGPSPKHRIRIKVGVAYGSDVDQVRKVLMGVTEGRESVCRDPEPRVRFRSFGDSSLDFELLCWIPEPSLRGRVIDDLNTAVYKAFTQEKIEIPFPQTDVHVRDMPSNQ